MVPHREHPHVHGTDAGPERRDAGDQLRRSVVLEVHDVQPGHLLRGDVLAGGDQCCRRALDLWREHGAVEHSLELLPGVAPHIQERLVASDRGSGLGVRGEDDLLDPVAVEVGVHDPVG